jgi:hypothetical protein
MEQNYNKNVYSKLVLNKLKVMMNSTYIYTHWAFNSIYMGPMFTYVWIMSELKFN